MINKPIMPEFSANMLNLSMLPSTLLLFSLAALLLQPQTSLAGERRSRAYDWIEHPWQLRYFIYVDKADWMIRVNQLGKERNLPTHKSKQSVYRDADEFLPPAKIMKLASSSIGIIVMKFSTSGRVLDANNPGIHFESRHTELGNLVLLKNGLGDASNKPYHFAYWWELPGKHFMSPAVCSGADSYRYKTNNPKNGHYIGGFGCREWSAQLQDDDHPYIDVTSYYDDYNIISDFVGWSGFENKPKPVIGKHMKTWVCLHECPNGEEPGIISNIGEWTKKHGFPMPVRPKRQPEFPDSMFKDIYEE
jgi:hypothetical protein